MSQQQLLVEVCEALKAAGIKYIVSGSIASSIYGEPRLTHDIDLVVSIRAEDIKTITGAFPAPRFYLDAQAISEAIETTTMFNLIDTETGDKVDFWIAKDDVFDASRFSRRQVEEFAGKEIFVASPEDTILVKLQWSKELGGSRKQILDAVRVYEVQFGDLDEEYMSHWVKELALETEWSALQKEARPFE